MRYLTTDALINHRQSIHKKYLTGIFKRSLKMQEGGRSSRAGMKRVSCSLEHDVECEFQASELELDEATVAKFTDLCSCFESEDIDSVWAGANEILQAISVYPGLVSRIPVDSGVLFFTSFLEDADKASVGLELLYAVSRHLYQTSGDFRGYVSGPTVDSSLWQFLHEQVPLSAAIKAIDILAMMASSRDEVVIGSLNRVGIVSLMCSMLNYFCPIKVADDTPDGDLALPYKDYRDESETHGLCKSVLWFLYEFMSAGEAVAMCRFEPVLKYAMAISQQQMEDAITGYCLKIVAVSTATNFRMFNACCSEMSYMRALVRFATDAKFAKAGMVALQNVMYHAKQRDIMTLLGSGVMQAVVAALQAPDESLRIHGYMCIRNMCVESEDAARACAQYDGLLQHLGRQFPVSSYKEKNALGMAVYSMLDKGDLLWGIMDQLDVIALYLELLVSMDADNVNLAIDVLQYILHKAQTEEHHVDAVREKCVADGVPEALEECLEAANPSQHAEIQSILEFLRV